MKRIPFIFITILFCSTFGLLYQSANAHGGGELVLKSASAGPYLLSVWVTPPEPKADEPLHFTIGVASAVDQSTVLDVDVQIEMELAGETRITSTATTAQSTNKLLYETDLEIETPGIYTVHLSLAGDEGNGETTFQIEVHQPPTATNWLLYASLGFAAAILLGIWRRASLK